MLVNVSQVTVTDNCRALKGILKAFDIVVSSPEITVASSLFSARPTERRIVLTVSAMRVVLTPRRAIQRSTLLSDVTASRLVSKWRRSEQAYLR